MVNETKQTSLKESLKSLNKNVNFTLTRTIDIITNFIARRQASIQITIQHHLDSLNLLGSCSHNIDVGGHPMSINVHRYTRKQSIKGFLYQQNKKIFVNTKNFPSVYAWKIQIDIISKIFI